MNSLRTSAFLLSLLCCLLVSSALPYPDSKYDSQGVDQYGNSRYAVVDRNAYIYTWASLPWTNTSNTFALTHQAINRLADAKKLRVNLALWERKAAQDPGNAVYQFRYAFAAYRDASDRHITGSSDRNFFRKLCWHLSVPDNPRSYEYDRLRFLLQCEYSQLLDLMPLGRRLQKKNPRDAYVNYWVGVLRVALGDIPYTQQLVQGIKKDVDAHPLDAERRIKLAGGYFTLWGRTKRRFYAQAAVDQYKQFLRLYPNTPQNAERRNKIEGWTHSILDDQTELEKKGIGKP